MSGPVVRVPGGLREAVALFLVEHRGVLSVIDTGTPGTAKRILSAVQKAGRAPEDVRQIVLTHCHGDHAGSARELREATQATIVAGAADVDAIEGTGPYPGPPGQPFRSFYANLARYPRLGVDRVVDGPTHLDGGLVALPAPGHTAGHLVVHAPDLDSIFAGDLVWNLGRLRPSWKRLTQDPERNAESIREIAAVGAGRIIPGHGSSLSGDRLRSLARRLAR